MEFPKINVSSKADIQYLADIWRANLYTNLEQQHGDMSQVQPLLDQWLEKVIEMSSASIDINGIPYREAIINDDVEPLDESLASKVQRQRAVAEDLMLKVAERRKRVPEQVKMLLDDALRRQAALADRIEFEQGEDEAADISEEDNGVKLERLDLVTQEFTSSLALLSGLKKTVSSNIARIDGAQAVVDETLP
ncbi:hypothetical protein EMPS_01700 [Entomortierella parvispora]|uniref:Kinetochore protein mis14 n=1 Tax=Entomortierella parvispora TaxID=205924 RepID=A0A9P3LSX2_9FUNG|nr:hypothetical protein EMPS_01700 [Entomortierella parvispora]